MPSIAHFIILNMGSDVFFRYTAYTYPLLSFGELAYTLQGYMLRVKKKIVEIRAYPLVLYY